MSLTTCNKLTQSKNVTQSRQVNRVKLIYATVNLSEPKELTFVYAGDNQEVSSLDSVSRQGRSTL